MNLRCMPKTLNENNNAKLDVHFVDPSVLFTSNALQFPTWSYSNASSRPYDTFNFYDCDISNKSSIWVMIKEENCNLSLGVPLIFSISQDAEKLFSESATFREDISGICNRIAEFISDKDLTAIGDITVFQEEGGEPKLFITYGISNKQYGEILKLWDEACEQLAKTISVDSLKKVAVVFDQL